MKPYGLAIGALILFGLSRPGSPAPQRRAASEQSTGTAKAGASAETAPADDAETFLRRFIANEQNRPVQSNADLKANNRFATVIALVPDPNRTHLSLYFDRSVEALVWAVDDSGFTLADHWFPWQPEGGAKPAADSSGGDANSGKPGLLVFRGKTASEYALVWLVGDTPTGALDLRALRSSIGMSTALSDPDKLHIAGPSFSGSLPVLSAELKRWREQQGGRSCRIITGMATRQDAIQGFDGCQKLEATVENDKTSFHLFFDYVRQQHWSGSGEIALLTEDETAYGQVTDIPEKAGESEHEPFLLLRFPREIARVRNSYEQDLSSSKSGTDKNQPETEGLQLKLSTPENDRDSIPAFSKQQTPISQEAVLLRLAATIRRERVRYAGIFATDVLDAIFLTRFLKTAAPDVGVFLFDADLLFARAAETSPLEGVLSITSYPLFSRNQHWTRAQLYGQLPQRTPFPSRSSQGVYNAARALLWDINSASGDEWKNYMEKGELMLEYMRPFAPAGDKPPLWLTVLGRDGYWPVALLDTDPGHAKSGVMHSPRPEQVSDQDLDPESPSHLWSFVINASLLLSLFHCLYIWFVYFHPQPRADRTKRSWRARAANGLSVFLYRSFSAYPQGQEKQYPKLLLLMTLPFLAADAVFASSAMPYVCRRDAAYFSGAALYLYLSTAGMILLAVTAVALLRARVGREDGRGVKAAGAGAFVLFIVLWGWILSGYGAPDRHVFFFLYRMLHPENGVSGAAPVLLLLGVALAWSFAQLARRATVMPPEVPCLTEVKAHADRLNRRLAEMLPPRHLAFAGSVVFLWAMQFHPWIRIKSVEGSVYDWLIIFLLALAYGLVFSAWVQAISAWSYFRRFLESLERHPMRSAFTRLPKEFASLPLFHTGPQKANLFTTARCLDSLDVLLRNPEFTRDEAVKHPYEVRRKAIHHWMGQAQKQLAASDREQPALYHQNARVSHFLELSIWATSNALIGRAEQMYWGAGDSDSLDRAEEAKGKHELDDCDRARVLTEEFIALRLVMYIRHVLRQLRSLLWFVAAGFVLTVLALSSYPFQSHRLIELWSIGLFVVIGTGLGFIFAQMDRDVTLSRLTETSPHQLGKDFWVRMASFGALPLVTVITTQFPSIRTFAFSWLQPALEALK